MLYMHASDPFDRTQLRDWRNRLLCPEEKKTRGLDRNGDTLEYNKQMLVSAYYIHIYMIREVNP